MADYQVPVDYPTLNSSYQDNTTNAITARHGRQLVANASPFFFDARIACGALQVNPGQQVTVTKQWCDDYGNNNNWMVNGFLVKQSDNTYLIENVTGATLLCMADVALFAGPFTAADHTFGFIISQQVSGEPERTFVGHTLTDQGIWGADNWYSIRDTTCRRLVQGAKLKVTFSHGTGTGTAPYNLIFRIILHGTGGWRGYASRYHDANNAERGQDVGGVKYE
jgi:hypothetical protein